MIIFLTYFSLLIAFVAIVAKVFKYITTPEHLRWELYPVPHEKGRSKYGGSYFEELDWWSKPRRTDMFNELKEMAEEIFLLKGVYRNNKRVWKSSFPFHIGMYLSIGWLVLLLIGAVLEGNGIAVSSSAGVIGRVIYFATLIFGYSGLILTGIGAFGLFLWRISNSEQRIYNAPADYINLILFDIVILISLISHFTVDSGFSIIRGYVHSLLTFSTVKSIPGIMELEIVLISLLIMYIPLGRMSHFVAKYFLYHSVRWNDEPNERGSKIEKSLMKLLQSKVGWSAPHIQTEKPWIELVKETGDEQKTD